MIIEQEQAGKNTTKDNKMSKYIYLLDVINIFTETLSIDQIMYAADEVFKTTFNTEPYIYTVNGNNFEINFYKSKEKKEELNFVLTQKLKDFAVFTASVLEGDNLSNYFPNDVLVKLKANYAIPLISSGKFLGVIFINIQEESQEKAFTYKVLDYLMRLIAISLDKYEKTCLNASLEKETSSRNFNLKSLNSMSHELFAELNLQALFELAIDAFLEITASEKIVFVAYDEKSEDFKSMALKCATSNKCDADFLTFRKIYLENPEKYKNALDLNVEMEREYFYSLFKCVVGNQFLNSYRYVVLIFDRGEILGFLMISESVNGSEFSDSLVDMVDILSTNTFLAIKNAKFFSEIKEKKKSIEEKLYNLLRLNDLMHNINSAEDSGTVRELIVDTLNISFNVTLGFLAMYDKSQEIFIVKNNINMQELQDKSFKVSYNWGKIMKGESLLLTGLENIYDYFEKDFIMEYIFEAAGMLIKPLCVGDEGRRFEGVLCLFNNKTNNLSDYEFNLYVDSIINHSSPMISNLRQIESLIQEKNERWVE